jgi:hypothetical protein
MYAYIFRKYSKKFTTRIERNIYVRLLFIFDVVKYWLISVACVIQDGIHLDNIGYILH